MSATTGQEWGELTAILEKAGQKIVNGIAISIASDENFDTAYIEKWLQTEITQLIKSHQDKTLVQVEEGIEWPGKWILKQENWDKYDTQYKEHDKVIAACQAAVHESFERTRSGKGSAWKQGEFEPSSEDIDIEVEQ